LKIRLDSIRSLCVLFAFFVIPFTQAQKLPALSPYGIEEIYQYDPVHNRYELLPSVSGKVVGYPRYLSFTQYYEALRAQIIKSNYQTKTDALSKVNDTVTDAREDLLPTYYVNSAFFESIFGGNTITVDASGGFSLDLGALSQKSENPSVSVRNQRSTVLDIDQQFDLNVDAQVGERLRVQANMDSRSSFDFQNLFKIEYTPNEDDLIRNIEFGNVSMPLNSSLMTGAQNLFGLKTDLQFGRTSVTAVYAEQRSQRNTISTQNGSVVNEFELTALDYEENTHFFLSQHFRDAYDLALKNYPFIASNIQITRIEVWVTNRSQQTENVRQIVGFQDLGEYDPDKVRFNGPQSFFTATESLPDNKANLLNPNSIGGEGLPSSIRTVAGAASGLSLLGEPLVNGLDYASLENARKLEAGLDYSFHRQLGYISLNQPLATDEVLAVSYEYTYNGSVYKVGEFSNDNQRDASSALIVKLLKSNITRVEDPIWDLMMKNIYATGAFGISANDFEFQLLYTDPSPRNFLTPADTAAPWPEVFSNSTLLKIFNLDRLDAYQNRSEQGDGFFDFVDGVTVDASNGRIIFTQVEPFGEYLFDQFLGDVTEDYEIEESYNGNQRQYVYRSLYELTKTAALQQADANRFLLRGSYGGSTASSGQKLSLGVAFALPGSVQVSIGGRVLTEGVDYIVDYAAGQVEILDPSLQNSGLPIDISVEDAGQIGQLTRRFTGVAIQHRASSELSFGGAFLNLRERPLTQKSAYGIEPINNSMIGANISFKKEVPWLTRLINQWPTIETEAPSSIDFSAEIAALIPSAPNNAQFGGEVTTYIDDFEEAQQFLDLRNPSDWVLSSNPFGQTGMDASRSRARLAWYTIDPVLYSRLRPSDITDAMLQEDEARRIFIREVYPETDVVQGQSAVQSTLDIAYYPDEAGPYNTASDFGAVTDKWAGTMRALTVTDFEQANIEYLQFWMLHPFEPNEVGEGGKLVIDLGNLSEDILPDGRKQYENGLGVQVEQTIYGSVPSRSALIYTFDSDAGLRELQDVGLDGLSDAEEGVIYKGPSDDPARDNYVNYLEAQGSIPNRYKYFNNPEGNTPMNSTDELRGSTLLPDVEDVDRDFAMNVVESYYQYELPINSVVSESMPYITTVREVTLDTGRKVRWVQYKIPLREYTRTVGGITDFRSIPFIRMSLQGFQRAAVLRFAALDLIQGSWRIYDKELDPEANLPANPSTTFELGAVNIEENSNRSPIPYVLPPGVRREALNNTNTIVRQNEQSLSMQFNDLQLGDGRGAFRRVKFDMRRFERLKLFVHAERIGTSTVQDNDLVAFLRIGTDYSSNYYQIEWPLAFTNNATQDAGLIWPDANALDLDLGLLSSVKAEQIASAESAYSKVFENGMIIRVKGNPSIGNISSAMIGAINRSSSLPVSAELWFNELRLAGINHKGGWAATANASVQLSDVVTMGAGFSKTTVGFGAIDGAVNTRSLDDTENFDFSIRTDLGQFLPKTSRLKLPLNYSMASTRITPEYDPVYQDIRLEDRLGAASSKQDRQAIREQAESYTEVSSLALNGIRLERKEDSKVDFFDPENITINYSHSTKSHRDFEISESLQSQAKASLDYTYTPSIFSLTMGASIDRALSEQRFRQVFIPGITLLDLPLLSQQNYRSGWNGSIKANPLKFFSTSFTATQNNIVNLDLNQNLGFNSVWESFFSWGKPNTYAQQLQLGLEIPFSAFKPLDFLTTRLDYGGTLNWQRGSDALAEVAGRPLHTVQTASTLSVSSGLDLKSGLKKLMKIPDAISSQITINYSETSGVVLPGYLPTINDRSLLQLDPKLLLGLASSDLRFEAARQGYLTEFEGFNTPFVIDENENFSATANFSIGSAVSIGLNYDRRKSDRFQEQFRVTPSDFGPAFQSLLANQTGSYSTTAFLLSTAFDGSMGGTSSEAFEQFKTFRIEMANRLAKASGMDLSAVDSEGYPIAYGAYHPEVLLGSFIAAYSGKSVSEVSLGPFESFGIPNWDLSISGLFPEVFTRFAINHGYRAAYSINNFQNNLSRNDGLYNLENGDIKPELLIGAVVMNDQFNPLIGFDFETESFWQIRTEWRKDRALNLSFANSLLTEIKGQEFVLGLGKRITDLRWNPKIGGKRRQYRGDMVLRGDVSYRSNTTFIRNLDEIIGDQITSGQQSFSAQFSADYALSNTLNLAAYYDHSFSKFRVSTSFPQTTMRAGLSLKYRFGE
jgi:cell surface protein SprA